MRLPISFMRRIAFLCFALFLAFSLGAIARANERANVVIDGRLVPLNPPAILREGSVFVPVRGVFENLGASVVFSNGRITAHGKHGESIVMDVGHRSASVNGQLVMLDNPPFIQGATTFVPLRFVSEALGATVRFDNRSKTVYIQSKQRPLPQYTPPPVTPAPTDTPIRQSQTFRLNNQQPSPGSNVRSANPAIAADFSENVDPNSVSIMLDGRDITSQAFVATNRFSVTPSFDLPNGDRTVSVTGQAASGKRFSQNWSFTVRNDVSVSRNFIQIRSPGPNETVSTTFYLAGRTLPLSRVVVSASTGTTLVPNNPGLIGPSFSRQTRADPVGNFSVTVTVPNAGGFVQVLVQSESSDGAAAEKTFTFPSR